jgi:metal-responsive CopG/Arc/MetJ family transcriptional regulator
MAYDRKKNKRINLDIPKQMYERFLKSIFRKNANTDSEGIRVALNKALDIYDGKGCNQN